MRESANAFGCLECGAPTRVLETKPLGSTIERKRECGDGHRFITRESFERMVAARGQYNSPSIQQRRASREQQDEIFNLIAKHIARETVKRHV